jgi:hypothetical protein
MYSGKFADFSRYAMLPFLMLVFGAMTLLMRDSALARDFPYYQQFSVFFR